MPSPSSSAVAKLTVGLIEIASHVEVFALWKPAAEADNHWYEVRGDANDPEIFLGYDFKAGPAFLELRTEGGLRITELGFLKLETDKPPFPEPQQHTKAGRCGGGGSFHLVADIPQEGAEVVEVKDLGYAAPFGYLLRLWVKKAGEPSQPFDPRVYNHGIIGHEDGEPWWRLLLQALRRLLGRG